MTLPWCSRIEDFRPDRDSPCARGGGQEQLRRQLRRLQCGKSVFSRKSIRQPVDRLW